MLWRRPLPPRRPPVAAVEADPSNTALGAEKTASALPLVFPRRSSGRPSR